MEIFPSVGSVIRLRIFKRVDFPAPLRPMMPIRSPWFTSKETFLSAQNSSGSEEFWALKDDGFWIMGFGLRKDENGWVREPQRDLALRAMTSRRAVYFSRPSWPMMYFFEMFSTVIMGDIVIGRNFGLWVLDFGLRTLMKEGFAHERRLLWPFSGWDLHSTSIPRQARD